MQQVKFLLSELEAKVVDKLTVHSFEMSVYLVELTVGDESGFLYHKDRPRRFTSAQEIRNCFAKIEVLSAEMRQQSPYDEMIGNPESVQQAAILPFSVSQPF